MVFKQHHLLVIVDIDGTLADGSTRFALAGPEPERDDRWAYRKWLEAVQDEQRLSRDKPNMAVLETVKSLYRGGAEILYLTAREEVYRDVTQAWLNKHGAPIGDLHMRGYEDWRSTGEYKGSVLVGLMQTHGGLMMAIDDDANGELEQIYQELGISHLKCMDNIASWTDGDNGNGEAA
jgi:hypothetical protein